MVDAKDVARDDAAMTHHVDRGELSDMFHEFLGTVGLDGYGNPRWTGKVFCDDPADPCRTFDNGTFLVRTYSWADCSCGHDERWEAYRDEHGVDSWTAFNASAESNHVGNCAVGLPNFVHGPTGTMIHWYKYALRGATSNVVLDEGRLGEVLEDCVRSLGTSHETGKPAFDVRGRVVALRAVGGGAVATVECAEGRRAIHVLAATEGASLVGLGRSVLVATRPGTPNASAVLVERDEG